MDKARAALSPQTLAAATAAAAAADGVEIIDPPREGAGAGCAAADAAAAAAAGTAAAGAAAAFEDRALTRREEASLLFPLLRLRQACCHPQVRCARCAARRASALGSSSLAWLCSASCCPHPCEWQVAGLGGGQPCRPAAVPTPACDEQWNLAGACPAGGRRRDQGCGAPARAHDHARGPGGDADQVQGGGRGRAGEGGVQGMRRGVRQGERGLWAPEHVSSRSGLVRRALVQPARSCICQNA